MPKEKIDSIESLYQFFDGDLDKKIDAEFSCQTKKIVKELGARGAHLNKWWVMTPTDWECPSCNRTKPQIAKLDHNRHASCQLHEHHDHMKDVVKDLFLKSSTRKEEVIANVLSERFAVRTSFAISAYDNTVICADCNKADGVAKKLVGAHPSFSYAPSEIAKFIISENNKEHDIDEAEAAAIWEQNTDMFIKRMQLAENIAELAANDTHWYKPSEITAKKVERNAESIFRYYGLDSLSNDAPHKLLYNTTPVKGRTDSWRVKSKAALKEKPTSSEIQHLAKVHGNFWNKFEETWSCPCCGRTKYECVQRSRKKAWIFLAKQIFSYNLHDEGYSTPIVVCNECYKTSQHFGMEAIENFKVDYPSFEFGGFYQSFLGIDELQKVIEARSHSSHIINNEAAEGLVTCIIERIESNNYLSSSKDLEERRKRSELEANSKKLHVN